MPARHQKLVERARSKLDALGVVGGEFMSLRQHVGGDMARAHLADRLGEPAGLSSLGATQPYVAADVLDMGKAQEARQARAGLLGFGLDRCHLAEMEIEPL